MTDEEVLCRMREKTHRQEKEIQKLYSMYSDAKEKVADYTYFFTDYLAHSTYTGYVKALRERGFRLLISTAPMWSPLRNL